MTQITLYTGNGASVTPTYAEGRTVSSYVRLVADDGMGITDGTKVTVCADVLSTAVSQWSDCDAPTEPEEAATAEEYDEQLERLGVTK